MGVGETEGVTVAVGVAVTVGVMVTVGVTDWFFLPTSDLAAAEVTAPPRCCLATQETYLP